MANAVAVISPNFLTGLTPAALEALRAADPNYNPRASELTGGLRPSFAVLKYKGKVWSINRGDESTPVVRKLPDGTTEQMPSVEVVIVRGSPNLAKTYYAAKYTEGSDAAPDCFSLDGLTPDATVEPSKRQCDTCAVCPHNVWGSKINDLGNKTKACSDSRRIAVVPATDIDNERFGGPMMLSLPPASLGTAAEYERALSPMGFAPHWVATRLGFDTNEAYPLITMTATRALTPEELAKITALREDPRTLTILFGNANGAGPVVPATPAAPPAAVAALAGATKPAEAVPDAAAVADDAAKATATKAKAEAKAKAAAEAKAKAEAEAVAAKAEAEAAAAKARAEAKARAKAELAAKMAALEAEEDGDDAVGGEPVAAPAAAPAAHTTLAPTTSLDAQLDALLDS